MYTTLRGLGQSFTSFLPWVKWYLSDAGNDPAARDAVRSTLLRFTGRATISDIELSGGIQQALAVGLNSAVIVASIKSITQGMMAGGRQLTADDKARLLVAFVGIALGYPDVAAAIVESIGGMARTAPAIPPPAPPPPPPPPPPPGTAPAPTDAQILSIAKDYLLGAIRDPGLTAPVTTAVRSVTGIVSLDTPTAIGLMDQFINVGFQNQAVRSQVLQAARPIIVGNIPIGLQEAANLIDTFIRVAMAQPDIAAIVQQEVSRRSVQTAPPPPVGPPPTPGPAVPSQPMTPTSPPPPITAAPVQWGSPDPGILPGSLQPTTLPPPSSALSLGSDWYQNPIVWGAGAVLFLLLMRRR